MWYLKYNGFWRLSIKNVTYHQKIYIDNMLKWSYFGYLELNININFTYILLLFIVTTRKCNIIYVATFWFLLDSAVFNWKGRSLTILHKHFSVNSPFFQAYPLTHSPLQRNLVFSIPGLFLDSLAWMVCFLFTFPFHRLKFQLPWFC